MHRFYRDRNKDKGGLGFVVAVVVTLAAAFLVGNSLMGKDKMAGTMPPVTGDMTQATSTTGTTQANPAMMVQAQPFKVWVMQAAALSTLDQAQKAVTKLADNGIAAAVVQQGPLYKVVVGAYTDPAAVEAVKATLQPKVEGLKMGMGIYPVPMTVTDTPAVVPVSATNALQPIQKAAQDMNVYLQQGATWMAGYATGQTAGVDQLQATAAKIAEVAKGMDQYKADAAVAKFLAMAGDVTKTTKAMTQLSQTGADADYQSAMAGYVTLLSEYKAWTMTPAS